MSNFVLTYLIVNYGMGSRILNKIKHDIFGETIFIGRGTIDNFLFNFLSLYDERKELVLFISEDKISEYVLFKLNKKFKFNKPNHGIAFTYNLYYVAGGEYFDIKFNKIEGVCNSMYQIIFTIIDRGKSSTVIEAAKDGGAKGGTIINARGSGTNVKGKLFNMDIEPEKEIVMVISKSCSTNNIVMSIRKKLQIDKPGNGIIFVHEINNVYGIYE